MRGLQGRYNDLKAKGRVRVKHVSVIVFGLSCAQIMYAWLVRPSFSFSPSSLPPPLAPDVLLFFLSC